MKPILEVRNLAKKYRIRHLSGGYLSLRERIRGILTFDNAEIEDFWALRDISFEVQLGESIGIIGRNGAGKSTLLKILSKITPPTKGKVITRGRIASLLEVGTGFHPELTGRENIFFNGSLLGMKRREIQSRFDEIVDFSGTEKFLDTPLKHYSSGMQLRLAFSVAAFLEPEILIIDEVLAVGDAEFQKKCMGKMEAVSKSGRTVLFVSHQLGMVSKLCKQALLLDKGHTIAIGEANDVINQYTQRVSGSNEFVNTATNHNKTYFLQSMKTLRNDGSAASSFAHNEEINLEVSFTAKQLIRNTNLLIAVNNRNGQRIFSSDKALDNFPVELNKINTAAIRIPREVLTPGNYSFFVAIHCPNTVRYDSKDQICALSIYDNGSEFVQYENTWFYGDVFVNCDWKFQVD